MGSDSPNLTISVNTSSSLNCSEEWDLHYYAFKDRSQIFNCGTKSNRAFTEIMLSIKNPAGIELSSGLNIKIDMLGSMPCPSGCFELRKNINKGCQCELSLFDVKSQMSKIFKASDLSKAFNLASIADWKWYMSPVFWVDIGFLVWFAATFLTVLWRLKNYCLISNFLKNKKPKSFTKRILTGFIV